MAPSTLAVVFSFVYLIIPVVLVPDGEIDIFAAIYVYLCVLLFAGSALLFPSSRYYKVASEHELRRAFGNGGLKIFFWLATFSLVGLIVADTVAQGFSVWQIMSNVSEVSRGYASMLYGGGLTATIFKPLYLILIYPVTAIGGLLSAMTRDSRRMYIVAALIPSFFILLVQSVKGTFVVCVFIVIGSIFLIKSYRGREIRIGGREVLYLVGSGLGVFTFAVISFYLRGFIQGSDSFERVLFYFRNYAAGHVYAFSDWFSNRYFSESLMSYDQPNLELGFYTFMAAFRMLGDDRPVPFGLYTEYFNYNGLFETNLYTIFRGLLSDFGVMGSLAVVAVMGYIFNFCYYRVRMARVSCFLAPVYILSVVMLYQSYTVSTLMWPTFVIGMVLLPVTLCIFRYFSLRAS